jgi:5'-phosphate synthase pdxT subunit
MKIGVLSLQGAFAEHIVALHRLGVEAIPIRLPGDLAELDGLIIPGGESTSISKLMLDYRLRNEISKLARTGLPILGTCAGMILVAQENSSTDIKPLGLMAIKVKRNAFGRQRESFEADLSIPALGDKPFHGVFIRAPKVEQTNNGVEILASLDDGTPIAVKQGKIVALAFHPELTDDLRFHKYFLNMINNK